MDDLLIDPGEFLLLDSGGESDSPNFSTMALSNRPNSPTAPSLDTTAKVSSRSP